MLSSLLSRTGPAAGEGQTPAERALNWAKRVYEVDARLPRNVVAPTTETAGYMIPTLRAYGAHDQACRIARWEASKQRPDGAFAGEDGIPYTFDTSQVVRGFLSVLDVMPEMLEPLRRACDYVERQIDGDGRVHTASYEGWRLVNGSIFSDYAHMYALYPLMDAGRTLKEQRYIDAAERGVAYFRRQPDLVEFKPQLGTLSHIFGYMMEALAELGQTDLAKRGLDAAAAVQQPNGAIPAYPGADWICSTGIAQLAVAWYKVGDHAPADKAMAYLESIQNPSGGFFGGYGKNAQYFPDKEIGWAVKYFLDAVSLRKKEPANV